MFLMYVVISLVLMGMMVLTGLKLEQKNEELTNQYIEMQTKVKELSEDNQQLEEVLLELESRIETLKKEKEDLEQAKIKEEQAKETAKKKALQAKETAKKKALQAAKANKLPAPNRGGGNRVKTFEATAYDLTVASCGKSTSHPQYGITASGYSLKGKSLSDRFIAVDPKVIKLGSVVHIEFFEPYTHLTGNYTAVDTGGAIKGHKVDIFFGGQNVSKEVSNFGRRKVRVTY